MTTSCWIGAIGGSPECFRSAWAKGSLIVSLLSERRESIVKLHNGSWWRRGAE